MSTEDTKDTGIGDDESKETTGLLHSTGKEENAESGHGGEQIPLSEVSSQRREETTQSKGVSENKEKSSNDDDDEKPKTGVKDDVNARQAQSGAQPQDQGQGQGYNKNSDETGVNLDDQNFYHIIFDEKIDEELWTNVSNIVRIVCLKNIKFVKNAWWK